MYNTPLTKSYYSNPFSTSVQTPSFTNQALPTATSALSPMGSNFSQQRPIAGSLRQPNFKEGEVVINPIKTDSSVWQNHVLPLFCYPNVNKLSPIELRYEDYYLIRTNQYQNSRLVDEALNYKRINHQIMKNYNQSYYVGQNEIKPPISISQVPCETHYGGYGHSLTASTWGKPLDNKPSIPLPFSTPSTVNPLGSSTNFLIKNDTKPILPFGSSSTYPSSFPTPSFPSSSSSTGISFPGISSGFPGTSSSPLTSTPFSTFPSSVPSSHTTSSPFPTFPSINPITTSSTSQSLINFFDNKSAQSMGGGSLNIFGHSTTQQTPFNPMNQSSTSPGINLFANSSTATSNPLGTIQQPVSSPFPSLTPSGTNPLSFPMQSSAHSPFQQHHYSGSVFPDFTGGGTLGNGLLGLGQNYGGATAGGLGLGMAGSASTSPFDSWLNKSNFSQQSTFIPVPVPDSQFKDIKSAYQKLLRSKQTPVDFKRPPSPQQHKEREGKKVNIIVLKKQPQKRKVEPQFDIYNFRVRVEGKLVKFQLKVHVQAGQAQIKQDILTEMLSRKEISDSQYQISIEQNIEQTVYCRAWPKPKEDAFLGDLRVNPSIAQIVGCQGRVSSLQISNEHGVIKWNGPLVVSDLNFGNYVQISQDSVEVFPDGYDKPEPGEGLNRPCQVTFKGSPKFRNFVYQHGHEGAKSMLQNKFSTQKYCRLVDLDRQGGWWTFAISRF